MARRKDNKEALFEAISKNKGSSMKLPDWAKPNYRPPQEAAEAPAPAWQQEQIEEPLVDEPLQEASAQDEVTASLPEAESVTAQPELPLVKASRTADKEQPPAQAEQEEEFAEELEESVEEDEEYLEEEPGQEEDEDITQAPEDTFDEEVEEQELEETEEDSYEQEEPQELQVDNEPETAQPEYEASPKPMGYSFIRQDEETLDADEADEQPVEEEFEVVENIVAEYELTHGDADETPATPHRHEEEHHHRNISETWPVKPPLMRASGDSVQITLSRNAFLASIAGVIVLVIIIFSLGRLSVGDSSAPQPAPDETGAAATDAQTPPEQKPAAEVESIVIASPGKRDADRYYLVLQQLKGSDEAARKEAFRIADFCKDKGWPVEVVNIGGNRLAVWSLRGLNTDEGTAAEQHALEAEKLGREYFRLYHTNDFRQRKGGDRNGKLVPYFISGSQYRK